MKRAISILATAATLLSATTATADEHTILILPDAYFPQITYLDEGDTVRFVNVSGLAHSLISKNDSWEAGPIPNEGELTMIITNSVQKTFYNKASELEDGSFGVEGRMSFAEAPVDDGPLDDIEFE